MSTKDWLEKDYYKVLGVSKNAKPDEIKKAFRKIARENHPDQHPGDKKAEARFKEASEAHSVLSDPKQRKEYDDARSMFGGGGFRMPGGGNANGFTNFFSNGMPNDDLSDILGGLFNGNVSSAPRKGADTEAKVTISFMDSINGIERDVLVSTEAGGLLNFGSHSHKSLKVRIPAGVTDGQRIRVRGKGKPGTRGGQPGDLYVVVEVLPDKVFGRSGNHLTTTVKVPVQTAILGGQIEVPTLDGSTVRLKVPELTPNGRTMRVRGKGVKTSQNNQGDLLVTVELAIPDQLNDKARQAMEAFAQAVSAQS